MTPHDAAVHALAYTAMQLMSRVALPESTAADVVRRYSAKTSPQDITPTSSTGYFYDRSTSALTRIGQQTVPAGEKYRVEEVYPGAKGFALADRLRRRLGGRRTIDLSVDRSSGTVAAASESFDTASKIEQFNTRIIGSAPIPKETFDQVTGQSARYPNAAVLRSSGSWQLPVADRILLRSQTAAFMKAEAEAGAGVMLVDPNQADLPRWYRLMVAGDESMVKAVRSPYFLKTAGVAGAVALGLVVGNSAYEFADTLNNNAAVVQKLQHERDAMWQVNNDLSTKPGGVPLTPNVDR
jgi:hypothetical protein